MEEPEFSALRTEVNALRSDISSVKGDVSGIRATQSSQLDHNTRVDAWLQNISTEIRKPSYRDSAKSNLPIIGALITGAAVLISLGSFALQPVREDVSALQSEIREVRKHDDGHPQYVVDQMDSLKDLYIRDREENLEILKDQKDKIGKLMTEVAVLNTIADERTQRFIRTLEQRDKLQALMSMDRFTGAEHAAHAAGKNAEQKAYAAGIEQRLRSLEEDRARLSLEGGRRHRGPKNDN